MSISVAQLILLLRSTTGQDSFILPDTSSGTIIGATDFLNRSFWEIANKFQFRVNEGTVADVTVAGQASYNPPTSMDAISHISILNPTSNEYERLLPMTIEDYRSKLNLESSNESQSTNYVRYGDVYYLYPTPNDIYTTQIDYLETLSDLVSGNPPVPREWHEIILYGAAWRVFLDVNGDIARSQYYTNMQTRLMNTTVPVQAKEEMDYSNAGVNVRGRTY